MVVRNSSNKLCAFVPHSPAEFWVEFKRNYPGPLEKTRKPRPVPRSANYTAYQVRGTTRDPWRRPGNRGLCPGPPTT
jgi:hypothetical protein